MYRVNFLPYRKEKKEKELKLLLKYASFCVLIGVGVIIGMNAYFNAIKKLQENKNNFLETHIQEMDGKIKEIATIKQETDQFIERKNVVESLQVNRSLFVSILNDLSVIPDGIFLDKVEKTQNIITITGKAASIANVSEFMKMLDSSKQVLSNFSFNFYKNCNIR